MSKSGGYKIINFANVSLSSTPVTLEGIFSAIGRVKDKAILLSGVRVGNDLLNDAYVTFYLDSGSYKCEFGNKVITVTSADAITVADKTSGGVTPSELAGKMEAGPGLSVDLNEGETKVVVGIDMTGASSGKVLGSNSAGTDVEWVEVSAASYTAGMGIEISNNEISVKASEISYDDLSDKLVAGANITISGSTISAVDTTYIAGSGIEISGTTISNTGVISVNGATGSITGIATSTDLQQGLATREVVGACYTKAEADALINAKSVVSGTNDGTNWTSLTVNGASYNIPQGGGASYSAGNGIDITNNVISTKPVLITIEVSQVVSMDPIEIQFTDAQAALFENENIMSYELDLTQLGIAKTYWDKSYFDSGFYQLNCQVSRREHGTIIYESSTKKGLYRTSFVVNSAGTGISISGATVSNTGVLSVNGATGAISVPQMTYDSATGTLVITA